MTVQIAAASTALILGEDRRANGQWDNKGGRGNKRETTVSGLEDAGGRKALARCGIVLDVLGRDALRAVRDGATSPNAAYRKACVRIALTAQREQRSAARFKRGYRYPSEQTYQHRLCTTISATAQKIS
ncbi:hypothetical protein [Hoyosella altamirensis]|uniref:Uncharacterized protein n=1 Tax=Hoyosella altamirensis TaxID=616997 RepID=A0A839RM01_9ACTN|nr:hypothetical protein [Hoyosella altamirensis]MBB3037427.1 hypothetical protein [Hoyosella altamirensis]MBB3037444.1 hypothetical protein [Hoyosella altamirensis]